jgi:hypothetical protein
MKKQTSFFILLLLLAALGTQTGCRTNGAPFYRVSSWEFYNPFSKMPKKDKTIDDYALANDIEDSSRNSLPKTEVSVPRDGYLNGNNAARETRVATAVPASTRVNTETPRGSSIQPSTTFAGNNYNNTAISADPLAGTASPNIASNNVPNNTIPTYGSTTQIGANNSQQAGSSFAMNQTQNTSGQFNTAQQGMPTGMWNQAGMNNDPNMIAGNTATVPTNSYNNNVNGQVLPDNGYNPSAMGMTNPNAANPNGMTFAQNPTLATPSYQTGNGYDPNQTTMPGLGVTAGATPNTIASNSGAGYVSSDLTTGNSLNNSYNSASGTVQPNVIQNPNQPLYPNNAPGAGASNIGIYGTPTSSTAGNPNAMNLNNQNPQNQSQIYNNGFQSFAPANDDSYRPGGY